MIRLYVTLTILLIFYYGIATSTTICLVVYRQVPVNHGSLSLCHVMYIVEFDRLCPPVEVCSYISVLPKIYGRQSVNPHERALCYFQNNMPTFII